MTASRGREWPPAAMTLSAGAAHAKFMVFNTFARALGAAVAMPWRALAATRAAMAFGHDWDYDLADDYEVLDELCRPNTSPLLSRENGGSAAVSGNRC